MTIHALFGGVRPISVRSHRRRFEAERVFGANTGDVWKGPGGVGRGRGQRGVSEPNRNGRPRGKGAPMRRIAIALGVALSDLILE